MFETTIEDLKILLTNILSQRTTRRYSSQARGNALERANLKICSKANFSFLNTTDNVSIVAGNREFDLPNNFMRIDTETQALYLNTEDPENMLDYIRGNDIKGINTSNVSKPTAWYQKGKKGILDYTPDTSYTGILEYYRKPPLLSSEILIPPENASIIAWWGALELLSPTNPNRPMVESEAINQLNELINDDIVQSADNQQQFIEI